MYSYIVSVEYWVPAIRKVTRGQEIMVKKLSAPADLSEDPDSILSTH